MGGEGRGRWVPGAARPPSCRPESWAVGRSGKGLPRAVAHPQPTQLAVSTAVPRRAARPLQCDALPRARGWRRVGAPARPHHAWNLSAPSLSAPGWGVTRATRQVARGRGAEGPGLGPQAGPSATRFVRPALAECGTRPAPWSSPWPRGHPALGPCRVTGWGAWTRPRPPPCARAAV